MGRKGNGYGSERHFDHYRRVLPYVLDQQIRLNIGRTDARLEWIFPDAGAFAKEPRVYDHRGHGVPTHVGVNLYRGALAAAVDHLPACKRRLVTLTLLPSVVRP